MWEIFEVKNKEEAELLILGLNCALSDPQDMRNEDNEEKMVEHNKILELIERLS